MIQRKTLRVSGSDLTSTESLDFRELIASASACEIKAACLYEYFRSSEALGEALSERKQMSSSFLSDLTFAQIFRLRLHLGRAGFTKKAWKHVKRESQVRLIQLLAKWREEQMQGSQIPGEPGRIPPKHPPLIIEPAQYTWAKEHDLAYYSPEEPEEPKLFQTSGEREYFKGFIRIDEAYNETKVVEAFRAWFRKHHSKTKGGGTVKWRNRLKQLSVMRIWKKHERDQWKRLKLVAKFCKYKGCVTEVKAYNERRWQGRAKEPMSNAAKAEMSNARTEARKFFKELFPGEEPLSWPTLHDDES